MMRLALFTALTLALASPASAGTVPARAAAPTEQMVRYTVKRGDTLIGLADRYMLRHEDYLTVQQLNRVADPRKLVPSSTLLIPLRLLRGTALTARVLSYRGAVSLESPAAPITPGKQLPEGTLLRTGANAFVTIAAADGSTITLPSQSALRLSRMRRILLTGSIDQEFSVERGRAETRVVPQRNPNDGYRMRTPIAVSAVRGTEFRIGYEGGPSRTEVLGGTVAVAADGAAPTAVPKGVGAGVAADGRLFTEQLLAPPELLSPDAVQSDAQTVFKLSPVPRAARYRVQLARDAGFGEIFDEQVSDTPNIAFADVPDGSYFARATAISATGFEGLPAVSPFTRKLIILEANPVTSRLSRFTFSWRTSITGDRRYRFQLMRERPEEVPFIDQAGLRDRETTISYLPPGTYYWRVGMTQYGVRNPAEKWTEPQRLVVIPLGERR